jgi:hypothetical protein
MIEPHRRRPLSRRLGGVLAGAALSSLAVVTSVVVMWVDRDSFGADSGVLVVIAAAVGVPVFLLGSVALVLLSGRTGNARITNTATALAVFVSLLPMGLIFLREVWAAFAFSILFAVLVALVLTEPTERGLPKTVRELAVLDPPGPSASTPAEPLPPTSPEDAADAVGTIAGRLPRPWQRRLSRGSRVISKRGETHAERRKRKIIRFEAHRHGYRENATSPREPSQPAPNANDTAPSPQDSGRDSTAILDAFLERMESTLDRLERALRGRAAEAEEMLQTPTEGLVHGKSADVAETSAEQRLALLYGQVEASVRRLDSLVADADLRFKEWLAAARDGRVGVASDEPDATANASEVLRSVRDDMAILVKGLDGVGPASSDFGAQIAAIRSLKMLLARFVEQSGGN